MLSLFGKKDWRKSKAHLFLLSRFLNGADPRQLQSDPRWAEALGESLQKVVDRFVKEGVLVPAPAVVAVEATYTVPQLRTELRSRGLPVSGVKHDLATRLVEADPSSASKLATQRQLYICAPSTVSHVREFIAESDRAAQRLWTRVWQLIGDRRLRDAAEAVIQHNVEQVFPPGLGIDWSKQSPDEEAALLDTIMAVLPGILSDVPTSTMPGLRRLAAMTVLSGGTYPRGWTPPEIGPTGHLKSDVAVRMLVFHVRHLANLAQYRDSNIISRVRILATDDSCPACSTLAGRTYRLNDVPELPLASCTSEKGCRCVYTAVID